MISSCKETYLFYNVIYSANFTFVIGYCEHCLVILLRLFSLPIHNNCKFGYSSCVYSPYPFTPYTSLFILAVFILPTHSRHIQVCLFLLCLFSLPIQAIYKFVYSCCVYSPYPFTPYTSLFILAVFILPTHSRHIQVCLFLLCLFSLPIHAIYKFVYSCCVYSPYPFTQDSILAILTYIILAEQQPVGR